MDIKELYKIYTNSVGIATDSRVIKKGQIFFALKGENFNGNKYAVKAIEQGASYAIVDEEMPDNDKIIKVDNVLECLQSLATYHRDILNIPILAITGTNGKTTTKELVSSVLLQKYKLAYTQGNFNNHVGVPLTILSFKKDTQMAVVEMGANHPKEIAALCKIAKPNFGIITNIGRAHLEGFGSFEKVVETKTELYEYLKTLPDSKVFYNADDDLLDELSRGLNTVSYGLNGAADTHLEFIGSNPFLQIAWKTNKITTNLVGDYNFDNVAAAICVGEYFKVPEELIVEAIHNYQPKNNRSQLLQTSKNNTVIIDAYNANPESMRLSIDNFSKLNSSDKILILGDMLELGNVSYDEHKKVLEQLNKLNFSKVFIVGKEFNCLIDKYPKYKFMKNTDEVCKYLENQDLQGKTILLKASRGIQLEKTLQYL